MSLFFTKLRCLARNSADRGARDPFSLDTAADTVTLQRKNCRSPNLFHLKHGIYRRIFGAFAIVIWPFLSVAQADPFRTLKGDMVDRTFLASAPRPNIVLCVDEMVITKNTVQSFIDNYLYDKPYNLIASNKAGSGENNTYVYLGTEYTGELVPDCLANNIELFNLFRGDAEDAATKGGPMNGGGLLEGIGPPLSNTYYHYGKNGQDFPDYIISICDIAAISTTRCRVNSLPSALGLEASGLRWDGE